MPKKNPQHTRKTVKNRNGWHIDEVTPSDGAIVPFDAARKAQFCALIAVDACLTAASATVGVSRATVRLAIRDDPEFREMFEHAMDGFREKLLRAANRRGIDGVERPVYFKGKRVDKDGENREYSDALLIRLLEQHVPGFRTKTTVENHNVNVDLGAVDLSRLSPSQQLKLRALLEESPNEEQTDARAPIAPTPTDV